MATAWSMPMRTGSHGLHRVVGSSSRIAATRDAEVSFSRAPSTSRPSIRHVSKAVYAPENFERSAARSYTTDSSALKSDAPKREAVQLAFEHTAAPSSASSSVDADAFVLCHGLFGSKQNWRSISKSIAQRAGVPVYAVDLRNHGTSPHIASMRYEDMAADLLRFFADHKIRNAVLVGHSLGGKAVQSMALDPSLAQDALSRLVSVDMTPARGPLSPEFARYIEAMVKVENGSCKTRDDAARILSEVEPNVGIVQFLSTNLHRAPEAEYWGWRIPLNTIRDHLPSIGDFPYDDAQRLIARAQEDGREVQRPQRSWNGPTLFIKGEQSKYINRKNIPICEAFFPKMKLETLPTGHWVQAEKPREFVDVVLDFAKP